MVDRIELSYINAYNELLNNVSQKLKEQIEKKSFVHRDILEIARSIIVKKENDGTISVSKNILSEKEVRAGGVSSTQINLIKELCSRQIDKSEVTKNKKRKPEDSQEEESHDSVKKPKAVVDNNVAIARNKNKRKQADDPEDLEPTKRQKQDDVKPEPKIRSDEDFFDIKKGLPQDILSLTTSYFDHLSDIAFDFFKEGKGIPECLKNLETLYLANKKLDIDTFDTIITSFPNIKSLSLPDNADNEWLEKLAEKLPNLTSLSISSCNNISDISSLKALTHLTNLSFSYCRGITDFSPLIALTSLTHFTATCCANIGDFSILKFITSLTRLDLSQSCNNVEGISALTSLNHLDLSMCNLTDIRELSALKELTYLNLSLNRLLSDINSLAHLTTLKHLDLSWCENVNNAYELVTLTNLTYLNLSNSEIPYDTVDILLTALKNLKTIYGTIDDTPVEYDD